MDFEVRDKGGCSHKRSPLYKHRLICVTFFIRLTSRRFSEHRNFFDDNVKRVLKSSLRLCCPSVRRVPVNGF